ncbi:MAG TPA: hypothetical protein VGU73_01015 [Acidimicrobiia bacterium]|nr:hypothetical protein [Acidimicrobiia bacterium]
MHLDETRAAAAHLIPQSLQSSEQYAGVHDSAQAHSAGTIDDVTAFLNDTTGFIQTLTSQANDPTTQLNAIFPGFHTPW